MDIAIELQDENVIDIESTLGFNCDLQLVQDWLETKNEVEQAFVLFAEKTAGYKNVIAFIVLDYQLSKKRKQAYINQLKTELFNKFEGYILPCTFVLTANLAGTYTNDSFKKEVLQEKLGIWEVFDTRSAYWANTLTNIPHLHNLSTDKAHQVNHTSCRQKVTQAISSESLAKLNRLSKTLNFNLFVIMQTIFSVLLNRYSNDTDILMGANYTEIRSENKNVLFETFIEKLLLRTHVSPNQSFKEQLYYNKSILQDAYLNRIDYSKIEKAIQIQECLNGRIFQINFNFHRIITDEVEVLDSYLELTNNENLRFNYDLELNIINTSQSLFLSWFYDANIFENETIERVSNSFVHIVEAILISVDKTNYSLPLFDGHEAKRLLDHWNDSATHHSSKKIHEAFAEQVVATPKNVALKFQNKVMTYEELDFRASQLARQLEANGLKTNSIIAIYLRESFSLIIAIIGIFKAKASYMPLDVNFPTSRLEFLLNDSKITTLLTTKDEYCSLNKLDLKLNVIFIDQQQSKQLSARRRELQGHAQNSTDLTSLLSNDDAYLMYTSGSTKDPKGVIGTHKSVINRLNWMNRNFTITEKDIFCLTSSVSAVDHIAEIFQPLIFGASLVLLNRSHADDITQLLVAIEEHRISRITLLPSALKSLLNCASNYELNSLNIVISSGEPLSMSLVESFYRTFESKKTLLNIYGSTETGADVSCFEVDFKQYFDILNYFTKQEPINLPISALSESDAIFSQLVQTQPNIKHYTRPNVSLDFIKKHFLSSRIPDEPVSLDRYLNKLKSEMLPYMINISSGKYIGHMTSPLPYFIPELSKYIAMANQNIVKIETAKSVTFMERQVLAMLHRLFFRLNADHYTANIQNPNHVYGLVTSGGSVANITALYCARNSSLLSKGITEKELSRVGAIRAMKSLGYSDSVLIVSRLAHYSIKKAAALLGLGLDSLLIIEQDDSQKIDVSALEKMIRICNRSNRHIIAIIGIAGATDTGTIDPLDEMANIAEKHQIHFHVDGAWGGAFIFSEKYKHKLKGISRADSITLCAHKQLYIAQGMSVCLFKNPKKIFSIATHAEYQSIKGSFDLGQYTLEGSRPALSVLLHASLHLFSSKGYAQLIEQSMDKTSFFSRLVDESDCFQLVGKNDLNIINYRYIPKNLREKKEIYTEEENKTIDKLTEQIQEKQFCEGKTFVSRTRIYYKPYSESEITVFRVVLANPNTTYEDLVDVLNDQLRIATVFIEKSRNELSSNITSRLNLRIKKLNTVPLGRPIDNVKLYILDEYLSPSPIGVAGELYIAGDCLASGYLNNSNLNKQSFVINPFCTLHNLMFKTNDIVRRLPDGNIEYIGRKDILVKLKGHRLRLNDVKAQLDKLEIVKNSIVLVENDILSDNTLTAYIEIDAETAQLNEARCVDQIKTELEMNLPAFMVPTVFKFRTNLPLTPNGKIDFRKL